MHTQTEAVYSGASVYQVFGEPREECSQSACMETGKAWKSMQLWSQRTRSPGEQKKGTFWVREQQEQSCRCERGWQIWDTGYGGVPTSRVCVPVTLTSRVCVPVTQWREEGKQRRWEWKESLGCFGKCPHVSCVLINPFLEVHCSVCNGSQ